MRMAIIGCGAMGSILGAQLAAAGQDIVLIDTWREHVQAIRENGLRIETDGRTVTVQVQIREDPPAGEVFDVVIILVKSAATGSAALMARGMLKPGGAVISFQNGIGNEEKIAGIIGAERTMGGTIYYGGNVVAPGIVRASQRERSLAIGALTPHSYDIATRFAAALRAAGFDCRVEEDVLALKWQKVLINIGTNAVATIRNEPNRVAGDIPQMRIVMELCCSEAIAVAKAKGVRLIGGDMPAPYVRQATDVHTYEHRSSMCLDLAAGKRTEIDVTNGAVESFGLELGIPTPINALVTAAIRRIEQEIACRPSRGAAAF